MRRGETNGDSVYVLDGLAAGDRVVTSDADKLSDGDRVKVKAS